MQVPKYLATMKPSDIVGSQCQLATKQFWGLAGKCYHNLLYFLAKIRTELSKRATLPNMVLFYEPIKLSDQDVALVIWKAIVGFMGGLGGQPTKGPNSPRGPQLGAHKIRPTFLLLI